jgi:hypothetical protein
MNNLSTTQQIQLVTSGFSIDDVKIANSFFDIQHAEVTTPPASSSGPWPLGSATYAKR